MSEYKKYYDIVELAFNEIKNNDGLKEAIQNFDIIIKGCMHIAKEKARELNKDIVQALKGVEGAALEQLTHLAVSEIIRPYGWRCINGNLIKSKLKPGRGSEWCKNIRLDEAQKFVQRQLTHHSFNYPHVLDRDIWCVDEKLNVRIGISCKKSLRERYKQVTNEIRDFKEFKPKINALHWVMMTDGDNDFINGPNSRKISTASVRYFADAIFICGGTKIPKDTIVLNGEELVSQLKKVIGLNRQEVYQLCA